MDVFITHQQFLALLDVLGPNGADFLHDLGIMDADRLEKPDSDVAADGIHDNMPSTITLVDVLDPATGFPWLSAAEAQDAVRVIEGAVDGPYRYDQIEAVLRKLDLPFEPPPGWFQWLDKRGDYTWTRWVQTDHTLASALGWAVRNYPASPTIEPIHPSASAKSATDMMSRLRSRAKLWRNGYRNSVTRVCSRAIALVDYHAAMSDLQDERSKDAPSSSDVAYPYCLRLKSRA